MANQLLDSLLHRCVLVLSLISLVLVPSILSEEGHCSDSRAGCPACDFNSGFCNWREINGKEIEEFSWRSTYSDGGDYYPVTEFEGDYIYLDPSRSEGKATFIEALVSSGVAGVCIGFYYTASGSTNHPIKVNLWDGVGNYQFMHEIKPAEIAVNKWQMSEISCCLPNVENGQRTIALEATSTSDAIVAIDYMDIHLYESQDCSGQELVCTWKEPTTVAPATTTTEAATAHSGSASGGGAETSASISSGSNDTSLIVGLIFGLLAVATLVVFGIWYMKKQQIEFPLARFIKTMPSSATGGDGANRDGEMAMGSVGFENIAYSPSG